MHTDLVPPHVCTRQPLLCCLGALCKSVETAGPWLRNRLEIQIVNVPGTILAGAVGETLGPVPKKTTHSGTSCTLRNTSRLFLDLEPHPFLLHQLSKGQDHSGRGKGAKSQRAEFEGDYVYVRLSDANTCLPHELCTCSFCLQLTLPHRGQIPNLCTK